MNPRRILETILGADEWITDHVFQPIANWLADLGITTFRAAQGSLSGVFLWGIVEIMHGSMPDLEAGRPITGPIIGAAIIALLGSFIVAFIELDRRGSQNIWVRPRAFVFWWGSRIYSLVALILHLPLVITGSRSWTITAQDFLYLFGLYIWACRPRPPSRRRAPAPASSNTERAS